MTEKSESQFDALQGQPVWEVAILAHISADSREAADEIVHGWFDHESCMGGNWNMAQVGRNA